MNHTHEICHWLSCACGREGWSCELLPGKLSSCPGCMTARWIRVGQGLLRVSTAIYKDLFLLIVEEGKGSGQVGVGGRPVGVSFDLGELSDQDIVIAFSKLDGKAVDVFIDRLLQIKLDMGMEDGNAEHASP